MSLLLLITILLLFIYYDDTIIYFALELINKSFQKEERDKERKLGENRKYIIHNIERQMYM